MTDWRRVLLDLAPHLSMAQIAKKSGVSRHIVYHLVEGRVREPRHSDGVKLLELHGLYKPGTNA